MSDVVDMDRFERQFQSVFCPAGATDTKNGSLGSDQCFDQQSHSDSLMPGVGKPEGKR